MLVIVGRKETAEIRSRIFGRPEAIRIVPIILERFKRGFGEGVIIAYLRSAQRSCHPKRIKLIAERLGRHFRAAIVVDDRLTRLLKSGEFSTLSGAALPAAYGPQPTRG